MKVIQKNISLLERSQASERGEPEVTSQQMHAINALLKGQDPDKMTWDESRAFDMCLSANLMWSPPLSERLPKSDMDAIASLTTDGVVVLASPDIIGPIDPVPGKHMRMLVFADPNNSKPLIRRWGFSLLLGPPFAKPASRHVYALEKGMVFCWNDVPGFSLNGREYHIDVAYQHNRDIGDVDAGIAFIEANIAQAKKFREYNRWANPDGPFSSDEPLDL